MDFIVTDGYNDKSYFVTGAIEEQICELIVRVWGGLASLGDAKEAAENYIDDAVEDDFKDWQEAYGWFQENAGDGFKDEHTFDPDQIVCAHYSEAQPVCINKLLKQE